MNSETYYKLYKNSKSRKTILITTGLLGSIEDSRSIHTFIEYFKNKSINVCAFDMFGHGKSGGNIEDFTLSKVEKQLEFLYKKLEKQGKIIDTICGISASSLSILKFALHKQIKFVILKSPAIEMYAKRNRELGIEKINRWKKDGIIELWKNKKNGDPIKLKYNFLLDTLKNFHNIVLKSNHTEIFIGSGKDDLEIPFFELNNLSQKNSNITLKGYKGEGHSFSDEGLDKLIYDIDLYLNKKEAF